MYPEWEMYDEKEEDRLEHLQILKAKGKGAPKKKKSAAGEYCSPSVGAEGWFGNVLMRVVGCREQEETWEEEVMMVGCGWVYDMGGFICFEAGIAVTMVGVLGGVFEMGRYQGVQLHQRNPISSTSTSQVKPDDRNDPIVPDYFDAARTTLTQYGLHPCSSKPGFSLLPRYHLGTAFRNYITHAQKANPPSSCGPIGKIPAMGPMRRAVTVVASHP